MTEAEFQAMTAEQQSKFLSDTMEEVHKTYKETPLKSDSIVIQKIQSAIETKGFNFFPHAICKALDAEAERQFQAMLSDIVKGIPPATLNSVKTEIIKWYNEEEERFEAYKQNYIEIAKGPKLSEIVPTFVTEAEEEKILPMKKKVKKK